MPFQGVKTKNSKGVMISRAMHMFGGGYKRQKDDTASLSSSSDAVATSTTINSLSTTMTTQEAVSHTTTSRNKYDSLPPWESPEQKTTAYYGGVQDDKRQESSTSSSSSPPLLLFEAYNGDCDTTTTMSSSSRRQNGTGAAASSSNNRRDAVTGNETSRWRHDTSKDSLPLLDHDHHRSSNISKSNISRTILKDPFLNNNNNNTEIGPTSTSNIHLLLLDEEDTDHIVANSHNKQQQEEETQATDHPEDALFDELVSARGRDALLLLHKTPGGGGVLETRDPHPSLAAVTTPTPTRASVVRVFQEEKPPPSLFPLDAEESRITTLQSTGPRYLNNNNDNQRRQDPPSSRGLPSPPRDPQGSFFSSLPSAPVAQLPKDPSADSALLVETSSSRLLLNNSNSDGVVGNGAASPSRRGTGPESTVCRTPPSRSQQQYISQSPVSSLIQQFETSHSPKHHHQHQQQQHLKLTWKNGKEVAPDNSTVGTSSSRSCMPAPTSSKVANNTIGSSHLKITWQNGKEVVPDATSGGSSSCTRITNTSHHVRRASAGDGNQNSCRRLQRRDSEPVVLEHQHHHDNHQQQQTQQTAGPRGAEQETSPSRRYKMFPRTSPMNNCDSSSSTRGAGGQHPSFLRDKTPLTTSTSFQTAAKLYSLSSDSVAANRGVDCTTTKPCDTDDFDILAAQRGATNDDFTKSTIDGDPKSMIPTKKNNIGKTAIDNSGVKNISTTTICTNDAGQPKNECQQQSHDDFGLLVAQRGSWNTNAESPAAGKHIGGIGNSSSHRACRTSNVQLPETKIRRNSDDFDMLAARATTLKLSDIPAFRDTKITQSTKNDYTDDIRATPKPRYNSDDFDMLAARAATLNLPDIPAFCDTKITQSTKNDDTDDIQATAKPRCNSDDFDLLAARATTLKLPDIPAWRDEDKITQAKARWNTDEVNMLASPRATLSNFFPQTADVEKSDQPTRRILQRSKSSSTEWNYRSLDLRGDQEDSLKDQASESSNERPLWARQYGPRKRVLNTEDPNELTYWVIDPMTGLCYLEISVEDFTPRSVEEFLAQEVDLEVDGDDRLQLSSKIWSQVNHASSTAMEASSAFARSCVTPKSKKTSSRGRRKIRPSLSFRAGSTKSRLTRSFSFNSVR